MLRRRSQIFSPVLSFNIGFAGGALTISFFFALPQVDNQAAARASRPGSVHNVKVYRVLTSNTIESAVYGIALQYVIASAPLHSYTPTLLHTHTLIHSYTLTLTHTHSYTLTHTHIPTTTPTRIIVG